MNNERPDVNDEEFARKAKAVFDDSVDTLDANTLSRLNRSRHAALQQGTRSRSRLTQWLPAGGMVAAALVVALVLRSNDTIDTDVSDLASTMAATEFEILLTDDSLEMLEELEFYTWMELEEEGASLDEGSLNGDNKDAANVG